VNYNSLDEAYSAAKKSIEAIGLVYVKMDYEHARPYFDEYNCIFGSKDFGIEMIGKGVSPIIQLILIDGDFKFRVATEVERLYGGYSFNVFESEGAKYVEIDNIKELRTAVENVVRKLYERMKVDKQEEITEALEAL
jgi:hypothetical protein